MKFQEKLVEQFLVCGKIIHTICIELLRYLSRCRTGYPRVLFSVICCSSEVQHSIFFFDPTQNSKFLREAYQLKDHIPHEVFENNAIAIVIITTYLHPVSNFLNKHDEMYENISVRLQPGKVPRSTE